jgi:hypothetical protein
MSLGRGGGRPGKVCLCPLLCCTAHHVVLSTSILPLLEWC